MTRDRIEFLSAVHVVSPNPKRLAEFYRDIVGLPIEEERHGDTRPHWGCTLGEICFAIHPIDAFPDRRSGVGSVKLAFTVFDIKGFAERLEARGTPLLYRPRDTGFWWSTAIKDPDGNLVEFTELRDEWFEQVEARRSQGTDLVGRRRAAREPGLRGH